jgi:hypothetical protein
MNAVFYGIGQFIEATFEWLLVPFNWLPVTGISLLMFFGMLYWLNLQGKYNRKARRDGTYV